MASEGTFRPVGKSIRAGIKPRGKMPETRWRVRVWFALAEEHQITRYRNATCKLCIVQWAEALSASLKVAAPPEWGVPKWTVEKLKGHLNGWQIVVHSGMVQGDLAKRHAHR